MRHLHDDSVVPIILRYIPIFHTFGSGVFQPRRSSVPRRLSCFRKRPAGLKLELTHNREGDATALNIFDHRKTTKNTGKLTRFLVRSVLSRLDQEASLRSTEKNACISGYSLSTLSKRCLELWRRPPDSDSVPVPAIGNLGLPERRRQRFIQHPSLLATCSGLLATCSGLRKCETMVGRNKQLDLK